MERFAGFDLDGRELSGFVGEQVYLVADMVAPEIEVGWTALVEALL